MVEEDSLLPLTCAICGVPVPNSDEQRLFEATTPNEHVYCAVHYRSRLAEVYGEDTAQAIEDTNVQILEAYMKGW